MAEVDPEALADVAYGIFEYSLNRGLQTQDKYLYALVEGVLTSERNFPLFLRNLLMNIRSLRRQF